MNNNSRIILVVLFLSSFCGYLEWGGGQHVFVLESETDILRKLFVDPLSVIHPFTIVPLIGQLLLFGSIVRLTPSKKFIIAGIICIGTLYLFLLAIGLAIMNWRIVFSALPFLLLSLAWILNNRR
jgi:hypothetical protein